jgi:regulator of replication initiation timing/Fe2+ or Zn2+ uptake regulation protein
MKGRIAIIMGLRRIEEKLTQEAETKRKGAELALKSLETMSRKVHELHDELQKLEKQYQADIKKNPELAQRLMKLREELGLPRAIGIYEVAKKPSFVQRLKGKDEYHNFIALQILELGKKLRNQTGGFVSISELTLRLNDESQGITIAINDINTALDLLKSNGMIHSIRQLSGIRVVEFFDPNLSEDHQRIIELAARSQGEIGLTEIVQETSWNVDRVNQALNTLIKKKIAIKSQTLDGTVLSFPGI